MNIVYKSIKYISQATVRIPFDGRVEPYVKSGEVFKAGDRLFTSERKNILASYFLPKELDVNIKDVEDYVCRIDGEYISSGEMIAERIMPAGLSVKRIVVQDEGIVDFSRLDKGYLDILSEFERVDFVARSSGKVLSFSFSKGLNISTDVCEVPLFSSNSLGVFAGTFAVLGDGKSIPSVKNLLNSYSEKIVFAGRFLHPDLARELYKRGCKYIMASSMDYSDFSDIDIPIGIISGFGNIYFDDILSSAFQEFNGLEVCVDSQHQSIKFLVGLKTNFANLFKLSYHSRVEKGSLIKSLEVGTFGMVGEVQSVEDEGRYVSVLMQDGTMFLLKTENVKAYEEDFSTMAMGITTAV